MLTFIQKTIKAYMYETYKSDIISNLIHIHLFKSDISMVFPKIAKSTIEKLLCNHLSYKQSVY